MKSASFNGFLDTQVERPRWGSPLQIQLRVWRAIMLRDMRARFFGNWFGYVVLVGWPIAHIGVLIAIYAVRGLAQPYGDSMVSYFAIALLPVMTVIYLMRFIAWSPMFSQPLLAFPIVKPLDLILAHGFLELISGCLIWLVVFGVVAGLGIDIYPRDIMQVFYAFGASLFLGFSLGLLNGVLVSIFRFWIFPLIFLIICIYMSSGAVLPIEHLPAQLRDYAALNPVAQLVEWMRSAYYDGYGADIINKPYVLLFCSGCLVLALTLDRFLRGLSYR